MRESQFGFSYTWADLEPIRGLAVIVIAVQLVGGILGWALGPFAHWYENLWYGGAVATFPGFLAGMVVQWKQRPGSLSANAVMVRRLGLVAIALTAIALAGTELGLFHES